MSRVSSPPSAQSIPVFTSYKTRGQIPFRRRWHRDWLVWATIDPHVDKIEPARELPAGAGVFEMALQIQSAGAISHILLIDQGPVHLPGYKAVARVDVLADRSVCIAQSIWRERHHPIPFAVIEALRSRQRYRTIEELSSYIVERHRIEEPARIVAACWSSGLLENAISSESRANFLLENNNFFSREKFLAPN